MDPVSLMVIAFSALTALDAAGWVFAFSWRKAGDATIVSGAR